MNYDEASLEASDLVRALSDAMSDETEDLARLEERGPAQCKGSVAGRRLSSWRTTFRSQVEISEGNVESAVAVGAELLRGKGLVLSGKADRAVFAEGAGGLRVAVQFPETNPGFGVIVATTGCYARAE